MATHSLNVRPPRGVQDWTHAVTEVLELRPRSSLPDGFYLFVAGEPLAHASARVTSTATMDGGAGNDVIASRRRARIIAIVDEALARLRGEGLAVVEVIR